MKNKEREQRIKFLQIQTLQSQLNPHFIFNVLSSIQSLVLNEKTELAVQAKGDDGDLHIRTWLVAVMDANSLDIDEDVEA